MSLLWQPSRENAGLQPAGALKCSGRRARTRARPCPLGHSGRTPNQQAFSSSSALACWAGPFARGNRRSGCCGLLLSAASAPAAATGLLLRRGGSRFSAVLGRLGRAVFGPRAEVGRGNGGSSAPAPPPMFPRPRVARRPRATARFRCQPPAAAGRGRSCFLLAATTPREPRRVFFLGVAVTGAPSASEASATASAFCFGLGVDVCRLLVDVHVRGAGFGLCRLRRRAAGGAPGGLLSLTLGRYRPVALRRATDERRVGRGRRARVRPEPRPSCRRASQHRRRRCRARRPCRRPHGSREGPTSTSFSSSLAPLLDRCLRCELFALASATTMK